MSTFRLGRRLVVRAPISGNLVPIEDVPDPVFAQRMVGDGVSIDPQGTSLVAPIDGCVLQLHPSGHALTIGGPGGVEVMVHVGIDTVQRAGRRFIARVAVGATVTCGDLLVELDPDVVAAPARSLLTQVVITAGARIVSARRTGVVRAGVDPILELELEDGAGEASSAAGEAADEEVSATVTVPMPLGLHARPAARLARQARQFAADVRVEHGDERGNAKSVVSLMALEIGGNDCIRVVARGADARAAIDALVPSIRSGLGDEFGDVAPPDASLPVVAAQRDGPLVPVPPNASASSALADPDVIVGVPASPGLAIGNVVQVRHDAIRVEEHADDPAYEERRLEDALDRARAELDTLQVRLHEESDAAKIAILAMHVELLDDPELLGTTRRVLRGGKSAASAWQHAYTVHADRLSGLRSALLAARAADLRDVGGRVLRLLTGTSVGALSYPGSAILVASDLTPADTATLDRANVLGFCTVAGSATSHVAILARSLGIPAIAAIHPRALEIADGTRVVLDGTRGTLRLNPSSDEIAHATEVQQGHAARRRQDVADASQPARTRDGHRVEVGANIGSVAEASDAVAFGADGVGLLRSEFLFLGRSRPPGEDEQASTYEAIAQALGPQRSLTIRTLDAGGDKPLPCLPAAHEDNPFLGERGIRMLLNHPEVLASQVRAILRAQRAGSVRAMVPMIATLDEWRAVNVVFERERTALGLAAIPLGMMVEVPSAAVLADTFAREVDFFSIGTNDLAQYTLAMDRTHPKVAPQVDALNPAVLRLIAQTVAAAHRHGKRVGVCGGIAGDLRAIPVLVGLGVDELSVAVSVVPTVKAHVRTLDRVDCEAVARKALEASTASEVRGLLER